MLYHSSSLQCQLAIVFSWMATPCALLIIFLRIFDAIQQEQVGGNEDLCPMKVITVGLQAEWVAKEGMNVITADHHVEWTAKEGVTTSDMVRCSMLCHSPLSWG
jgi:hypothetical protein